LRKAARVDPLLECERAERGDKAPVHADHPSHTQPCAKWSSPREPPSRCPAWNISVRSRGPSLARKRSSSATSRPLRDREADEVPPRPASRRHKPTRRRCRARSARCAPALTCAMPTPGRPARFGSSPQTTMGSRGYRGLVDPVA
jgi:hypothetical protein